MSETTITTRQVKPHEVSLQFTRDLQAIAQEAWTVGLDGIREPQEIKRAFNPNDPVLVTEARKQYKQFARHGRLVVAHTTHYGPPEAYAMFRNDVSPKDADPLSFAARSIKRTLEVAHDHLGAESIPQRFRNVVAWGKHAVAKPDAPKGVGTAAILTSLEGFRPDRESAVYIDDENEQARQ